MADKHFCDKCKREICDVRWPWGDKRQDSFYPPSYYCKECYKECVVDPDNKWLDEHPGEVRWGYPNDVIGKRVTPFGAPDPMVRFCEGWA